MSVSVTPSHHLKNERWPQRGNPDENPCTAWTRGEPFDIDVEGFHENDEARYDALTGTVLFRREDTLTTCYSVHPEMVNTLHQHTVREAVREQFWRSGGEQA